MAPILVTGAAGRVGGVGRTITELLLEQGKAVRAMVRNEDQRAQALRDPWAPVMLAAPSIAIDLPLKILIWEGSQRKTWISYNRPQYLQRRHAAPAGLVQ